MLNKMLTTEKVAELLSITPPTARKFLRSNCKDSILRIGRRIYITEHNLNSCLSKLSANEELNNVCSSFDSVVEHFLQHSKYKFKVSKKTFANLSRAIDLAKDFLKGKEFNETNIMAFRHHLITEGFAKGTVRKHLTYIQLLANYALEVGLLTNGISKELLKISQK